MLHLRNETDRGQEVRVESKRGPVRYEWHVPTLCGKSVPHSVALSGDGILYNVCPDCLAAR